MINLLESSLIQENPTLEKEPLHSNLYESSFACKIAFAGFPFSSYPINTRECSFVL